MMKNLDGKLEERVSKKVYGSKLSKQVYGSECGKRRHQDDRGQISLVQSGIRLHAPSDFDVITGIDVKYPRDVHHGTRQGHGAPESLRGRARSLKEEDINSF